MLQRHCLCSAVYGCTEVLQRSLSYPVRVFERPEVTESIEPASHAALRSAAAAVDNKSNIAFHANDHASMHSK